MLRTTLLPAILLPAALPLLSACGTSPAEINEKYRAIIEQRWNHYALKPGDTVTLSFYPGEYELEQTALVLPDGRTDLFLMPHYLAAGKQLAEFESDVVAAYAGTELQRIDAEGTRIEVTPREEVAYFIGDFLRPGPVPLDPRMTVGDGVSVAGGILITAAPWAATLRRNYVDPLHPDVFTVSLWDDSEEIVLLPGDRIELDKNAAALVIQVLREYLFGVLPTQFYSGAVIGAAF